MNNLFAFALGLKETIYTYHYVAL